MTIESLLSLSALVIGALIAIRAFARSRREFVIREGYAGLLYDHGSLVGTLVAGRHIRWGKRYDVSVIELQKIKPVPAAPGAPVEAEARSIQVLFAEPLLTVRTVPAEIRKKMDPIDRVPKNSKLGGVPLRILLSERSGGGALLYESLRVRPSQRDYY